MTIYTRKGDKGRTKIYRTKSPKNDLSKDSFKIKAIGAVDEVNSFLGICTSFCEDKKIEEFLKEIQKNLFVIGSILAQAKLRFSKAKTKKLEKIIDGLEAELPVLKNFVLPGGSVLSAHLQYARAIARRSERAVVTLSKKEKIAPQILMYLNRLSDFLFMFARKVNFDSKVKEEIWISKKY